MCHVLRQDEDIVVHMFGLNLDMGTRDPEAAAIAELSLAEEWLQSLQQQHRREPPPATVAAPGPGGDLPAMQPEHAAAFLARVRFRKALLKVSQTSFSSLIRHKSAQGGVRRVRQLQLGERMGIDSLARRASPVSAGGVKGTVKGMGTSAQGLQKVQKSTKQDQDLARRQFTLAQQELQRVAVTGHPSAYSAPGFHPDVNRHLMAPVPPHHISVSFRAPLWCSSL
jgi:hypothetical protein